MKVEIAPIGTLTVEHNIGSVLKQLANAETTGCLEVTDGSTKWYVSIKLGRSIGIDCSVRPLNELIARLRQLGGEEAANAFNSTASDMSTVGQCPIQQEISRLVARGLLDPTVGQRFSIELMQESLESLLWLQVGIYQWREERSPQSVRPETGLDLAKLIDYYQHRLTIWQNYVSFVRSPHQRPYLAQDKLLDRPVVGGTLSAKALRQITQLMQGITLRDLAKLLKQDELKVIQILIPYLRDRIVVLREPSALLQQLPQIPELNLSSSPSDDKLVRSSSSTSQVNTTKTYKIACIDDSPIVLDELERFLKKNGNYQLTKIENPIQASSLIFRLKPDLILMDVTMPNINGYQLCHLFRNSETFKHTPIIMVTGNKGMIDKAKAKIVGATDYLTKPFTEERLLEIVRRYLA